jgi:hypothetical protein
VRAGRDRDRGNPDPEFFDRIKGIHRILATESDRILLIALILSKRFGKDRRTRPVQRTGASRSAQSQFECHRRLAPVADLLR